MTTERIEPNFSGDGFSDDGSVVVTYTAVSPPAPQSTITAGIVDEKRRSGVARFILYGAGLSILVGFGILAASLDIETFQPTSEPAIELTSGESGFETMSTGVRQIPLAASIATSSDVITPTIPPPIPRRRPATTTANLEPALDAGDVSAPILANVSDPGLAEPVIPPTQALGSTSNETQSPPGASGGLISGIEDALARVDASTLLGPSDLAENAVTPVLLPPAAVEPPVTRGLARDPTVDGAYPPNPGGIGPYYEVAPLPLPGAYPNGDYPSAGYSTGPIPPQAIPFVDPTGDIELSEDSGPGIVRRTIDKTTGALARVLRPKQD